MIKIEMSKPLLKDILSRSVAMAKDNSQIQALKSIRIEAADGKIEFTVATLKETYRGEYYLPVDAPGGVCLDAKKLFDIVALAAGQTVTIQEIQERWIEIKSGSSTYHLAGISPNDFLILPDAPEHFAFVDAQELIDVMRQAMAVPVDGSDPRPHIQGVAFFIGADKDNPQLNIASTNGGMMHFSKLFSSDSLTLAGFDEKPVIVPRSSLTSALKFVVPGQAARIAFADNHFFISQEKELMSMNTLNGGYPDVMGLMTRPYEYGIVIDKKAFVAVLKRSIVMTDKEFYGAILRFKGSQISFDTTNPNVGELTEVFEIEDYDGPDFEIALNPHFVLASISAVETEKVAFEFDANSKKPCRFSGFYPGGKPVINFYGVIMPMSL